MKLLIIFGTRPELIKLIPVINELKKQKEIQFKLCNAGQHKQMIDEILKEFNIHSNYNLKIFKKGQSINHITEVILKKLSLILKNYQPDIVLVQGDTTTAYASSLACFNQKIKVAHLEAGLRTYDKNSPWPEEINRKIISVIADLHFAPNQNNKTNLIKEKILSKNIKVVGNTVIDNVLATTNKLKKNKYILSELNKKFFYLRSKSKLILITIHRRDNLNYKLSHICNAIKELTKKFPQEDFIFPVHANPFIKKIVSNLLSGINNLHIINHLAYTDFIYLLNRSFIILTDSGGIQEEAAALGKPTLILRDKTERIESLLSGISKLVGSNKNTIISKTSELLKNIKTYKKMRKKITLYGDGQSAKKILKHLIRFNKELIK